MNCTQMDQYLDAMMDGTLDDGAMQAVEAHCRDCAACAEKLKVTRQMMRVFDEMAPEMDVPLTAQTAWRGAIKRESGRSRQRRLIRYAGGIAAALVVAIGATLALKMPAKNDALTQAREADMAAGLAVTDEALIEADGAAEAYDMDFDEAEASEVQTNTFSKAAAAPMAAAAAPMREIVLTVENVDRVCDYAQDLVSEYAGDIDVQRYDEDGVACANLYIDLPAANSAEFIEAMRHFDRSDARDASEDIDGETSILLVLKSE